ncbi:GNAT family N-acetyltransferase [Roseicella aquatilis]|uniref:N-acetyltransferase n=1 Tax=Roseicella aquatilis TaxID=2527868 RepID=A0A4R4DME8_9PROT|nr:GNAT family protein [Roseicella aquatilis]TCZ60834.1 N-acetyltransferase [Roseicella aquatilis]
MSDAILPGADAGGPQPGDPVDPTPRPRPERRVLAGRSVTLEPLAGEHAAALWTPAHEAPDSWAWLPFGPFRRPAAFTGLVRMMAASEGELIWVARPHGPDGEPGAPAGWLGLLDIRPADAAIELGNIWFPPGLARTRAATEAMFLLLDHAFALGYRRVAWKCNLLNLASCRAAERLGFRLEGVLRAHMIVRGRRRDTAYFGLLEHEWPERRRAILDWLRDENFSAAGQALSSLRRPSAEP